MRRAKIAITLEAETLKELDRQVGARLFPSRSAAIQQAVKEKIERLTSGRLARECSKLDPSFEVALAEEGMSTEHGEWPDY